MNTTTPTLSAAAIQWLANGERGLSSETIFEHLTGVQTVEDIWRSYGPHTPSDPDDLRRCRLLLEQVPELAPKLHLMKTASKKWAAVVGAWDEICAKFDEESPDWRTGRWSAPQTFKMMKDIGC